MGLNSFTDHCLCYCYCRCRCYCLCLCPLASIIA